MTLDEAIEHYERNANQLDGTIWEDIADDSRQLADWLTDLRMYRESDPRKVVPVATVTIDGERMERLKQELEDEFLEMAKTLNEENDKLRETVRVLAYCANDMADCDKCLMNGSFYGPVEQVYCDGMVERLRELGIEVDE